MTLSGPLIIASRRPLRIMTLIGVSARRGPSLVDGYVALVLSGAGTARARRRTGGAAQIIATGQALPRRRRRLSGGTALALIGSAAAPQRVRRVSGLGTLSLSALSAAGVRRRASGAGLIAMTGQATPKRRRRVAGAGAIFVSGTGVGHRTRRAAGSGLALVSCAGLVRARRRAAGASALAVSGTGAQRRRRIAAGAGAVSVSSTGATRRARRVAGTGAVQVTGSGAAVVKPSWTSANSLLSLDLAGNRGYQRSSGSVSPASVLTESRASGKYAADSTGTYSLFGSGVLARTDVGLAYEPFARTNSIRNDSGQGGASGTAPTNVSVVSAGGLTFTFGAPTNLNGVDCVPVTVTGTATASSGLYIQLEVIGVIAATQGQSWANSAFLSVSGSASAINIGLCWSEYTSGGTGVGGIVSAPSLTLAPTSTLVRYAGVAAVQNATTAFIRPQVRFGPTVNSTYNFTLYIGWPTLERADLAGPSSASSPIRTTSAAVTRSADNVSLTLPASSNTLRYTFDDSSTQTVTVSPGAYTIPSGLNRTIIRKMEVFP